MRSLFSRSNLLFGLIFLIGATVLFGWLFDWDRSKIGLGLSLSAPIVVIVWAFRYWLIEGLIFLPQAEHALLKVLNSTDLDENSSLYPLLKELGFYFVRHRRALTVFRRGVFLHLLESPHGHRWHHFSPRLGRQEAGPEIDLSPSFVPAEYANIPTSMSVSLAEQLRGQGQIQALHEPGRPVTITLNLIIGYFFRPQNGTLRDAFEMAIRRSREERNQSVSALLRPHLERITGRLSPIDIKLRIADDYIKSQLVELAQRLKALGYEVISAEIDSITLPDSLETAFMANQELLRQSVNNYSSSDLARMLATQLGQGLRSGVEAMPGAGSFIPHMRLEQQSGGALPMDHEPDGPVNPPGADPAGDHKKKHDPPDDTHPPSGRKRKY